jgi:hypothetical protein
MKIYFFQRWSQPSRQASDPKERIIFGYVIEISL